MEQAPHQVIFSPLPNRGLRVFEIAEIALYTVISLIVFLDFL